MLSVELVLPNSKFNTKNLTFLLPTIGLQVFNAELP